MNQLLGREGPVGVEIIRRADGVILNFFFNGLVRSSERTDYKDITMPEALILLATKIRMGHL